MRWMLGLELVLMCLLISPARLAADTLQEPERHRGVGAVVGVSSANLAGRGTGSTVVERTERLGLAAGVSVRVELSEWVEVQPEVFWAMKGSGTEIDNRQTADFNVNYIEIAALARLVPPMSHPVRPYLLLGPTFGLLRGFEVEDPNGAIDDRTDAARRLDIGVLAGAGATWEVARGWHVSSDVRYDRALMSMARSDDVELENRVFFFMLDVSRSL
jgi:hypothetical protein